MNLTPLIGLFTVSDVHSMTDEILKMKHFNHPNVMTLIGVCVSVGGGPAIVMPFMENGSLLNYLRRDKKNITIKDDQDLETVSCKLYFWNPGFQSQFSLESCKQLHWPLNVIGSNPSLSCDGSKMD